MNVSVLLDAEGAVHDGWAVTIGGCIDNRQPLPAILIHEAACVRSSPAAPSPEEIAALSRIVCAGWQ